MYVCVIDDHAIVLGATIYKFVLILGIELYLYLSTQQVSVSGVYDLWVIEISSPTH